jgi:hypothetical protein
VGMKNVMKKCVEEVIKELKREMKKKMVNGDNKIEMKNGMF